MKKKLLLGLLGILLLVAALWLLNRALFPPPPDDVDARIAELERRLARSEQVRDSLDGLITAKEDSLRLWRSRDDSLSFALVDLRTNLGRQRQHIRILEQNLTRYDLPPDTLLRDLNHILGMLPSSPRAGSR